MQIYPEKKWDLTKFKNIPHSFWDSHLNQRDFFDEIAIKLDVKCKVGFHTLQIATFYYGYSFSVSHV